MFDDDELADDENTLFKQEEEEEPLPGDDNELAEKEEALFEQPITDIDEHLKSNIVAAAKAAVTMISTNNKAPKVKPSYSHPSPRVQRLQKSYVVRNVTSKYPTEIESSNTRVPLPLTGNLEEPLKSFIAIMRSYMGHDPAAMDLDPVIERILRSTKAPDESDSEHYQRLMAALQTLNSVATSRVDTLQALLELTQKHVSDERQHQRFTDAIAAKRDKANSEIARENVLRRDAEQALLIKKRREDHLGYLIRELEAKEARCKIALLDAYPDRPISFLLPPKESTNFKKRMAYLSDRIK